MRGVGGHGRARRQLLARSSEMKRPRLVRRVRRTLLAIESGGSGKTCKEAAAEVASYFFSSHDGCVGWRALAVIGIELLSDGNGGVGSVAIGSQIECGALPSEGGDCCSHPVPEGHGRRRDRGGGDRPRRRRPAAG